MTTLAHQLVESGFEKKTAAVLEILITVGSSSAGMLASRTKIKRPTVYLILDGLLENGLITRSKRSGRTIFHIQDPKLFIKELAHQEKRQFEVKLNAFSALSTLIEDIKVREGTMFGDVKIERLQRSEEIQERVGMMISSGDFCAIFNPNLTTVGKMKEINKEFLQKTAISKPGIREIIIDGRNARWYTSYINNPNHEIRYLPPKTKYELDMIIAEDSILIAQYGLLDENCIIMTHPGFANSFKTIFEIMWTTLDA